MVRAKAPAPLSSSTETLETTTTISCGAHRRLSAKADVSDKSIHGSKTYPLFGGKFFWVSNAKCFAKRKMYQSV